MISNCGHDERNKYNGGKAGDQTGGEWAVIGWYNRPWNYVLRHPDRNVGNTLAYLARAAAKNNLIGYDQYQRETYWNHLKASNYDPAQITIRCEADCSSGVAANVKAAGYRLGIPELQNVSSSLYSGNIRAVLKKAGFQVLTDRKYLTSPDYLLPGDILLYEMHHVATNLDTGCKAGFGASSGGSTTENPVSKEGNVLKGQKWLNSNYGTLIKRATGYLLSADGEYGTHSRWAAVAVWKDVVNRKFGYDLKPSNKNFLDSCKSAAKKAQIFEGASGTFTYLVQFVLSAKGYYNGSMDASFGNATETAVKAFQKSRGLSIDGVVGPETWFALFN